MQAKLAEHVVVPFAIINYLVDFLFITLVLTVYNTMVRQFMVICGKIGCPISLEKTEFGMEMIVFLGVLLDGKNKILAIPQEKKNYGSQLPKACHKSKKGDYKIHSKTDWDTEFPKQGNHSWSDVSMRNV